MSDRRYSTAAWQRTRRGILARDGGFCMIRGPRCTGYATTVHHIIPSSQRPDLFWEPGNLAAACARCNYSDGARLKAGRNRDKVDALKALVEDQWAMIAELHARIEELEAELDSRQPAPGSRDLLNRSRLPGRPERPASAARGAKLHAQPRRRK